MSTSADVVRLTPRLVGRPPIRIAVVGVGTRGTALAEAVAGCVGAELAALCDRSMAALTRAAPHFPGVPLVGDFSAILEDATIEAVVIATPASSHYRIAMASLAAGKHVLVDKPVATTHREARELKEFAERLDLSLMPGHEYLYSAPVAHIRSLLDSDEVGDVHFVSSTRASLGQLQADPSVVWDLAPHDFSILLDLIDERPKVVAASGRACVVAGKPDIVFVTMAYPSGRIAHVELSWLAPRELGRTTIVGSKRTVVWDHAAPEPVRVFDIGVEAVRAIDPGEFRLVTHQGDVVVPKIDASQPHASMAADFIDAVTRRVAPRSHIGLGLEVVRLIEEVEWFLARTSGE